VEDGYGERGGWTYRVISSLWTCPDDREYGQRFLQIGRVNWRDHPVLYPTLDDVFVIELTHGDSPVGHTIEQLEVDLGRMRQALDEPALIKAEFAGKYTRRHILAPCNGRLQPPR
jgi:hypothetical protein